MDKDGKFKIGFLSEFLPDDRRASSGTAYSIFQAMQSIGDIRWIPIRKRKWLCRSFSVCRKILRRLTGINIDFVHTHIGARLTYHSIKKEKTADCDVVIGFFCLHNIYNRRFDRPVIYLSDAPLGAMIDYYPGFTGMPKWNIRQALEMDESVVKNADRIVFSSDWAANALKETTPDAKIEVIEFGGNMDSPEDIESSHKTNNHIEILFLGVDWVRKGGDMAVEATDWLNANGIPARLHIAGIKRLPERHSHNPDIIFHGFLNKNNPADAEKLEYIMQNADILLLPTKAECSAIAFAEAAAHGLPVFTHLTGGTSSYVIDGKTGRLLPIGSSGADFGRLIKETFESGKLTEMARESKLLSASRLNWHVWSQRIHQIIKELQCNQ